MRHLLMLLLALFLAGCGADFAPTSPAVSSNQNTYALGRAILVQNADTDPVKAEQVAQSIDGLGSVKSQQIYASIAQWSNGQPELTGTLRQACGGVESIVNTSQLGASAVYTFLSLLRPDAGQGFSTSMGSTLNPLDPLTVQRAQDALTAMVAPPINTALNALVTANLGSNLSSLVEFQGLRILDPAAMPRLKRAGLASTRLAIPLPVVGTPIEKAIKIADMNNYLNATYDPTVGGFAAVTDQVTALVTPRQIIDGLRLDYVGGFQNETSLALLLFNDTVNMTYVVPFAPAMGGVFNQSPYPFTGTGFTSCVEARTVPEISQPPGTRTRLPVGAQLVEVDPSGARFLRGVLASNGTWTLTVPRELARTPLDRTATYKGVIINLTSSDGEYYWVGSFGVTLPDQFFVQMRQIGHLEYLGKIRVDDPELSL